MSAGAYSLPNRIAAFVFLFAVAVWATWGRSPTSAQSPQNVTARTMPPVPARDEPNPNQLFDAAVRRLGERRSVVAKVRHRAKLYGRELIGSGDYAQGPNHSRLLRYELRMQVNDRVVNQLQVCDGRYLWISRLIEVEPEIQRVEVDRVLAAFGQLGPGGAAAAAQNAIAVGGIGNLIESLQKDFSFQSVSPSQLGDVPVYALVGRWKSSALEKLPMTSERPIGLDLPADAGGLRQHVPTHVVVYLGVDDLFPYRLEYRRSPEGAAAGPEDAASSPGDDPSPRILVIEFFEVQFDVPLEERLFQFSPGSRRYTDITDLFTHKRTLLP
ncbi:MAG: hypothetical protein JNL96_15475 [Planctomycetaceae bacterium]|nr:hypothetical protein [Planctomycetaceae bacterium]